MIDRPSNASLHCSADMAAELPALITEEIIIWCYEGNVGEVYSSRVLGVEGQRLRINLPRRIAGNGYLRTSRPVVLNFIIDNQFYRCPAAYEADDEHTRELVINGPIEPTTRRGHGRRPMQAHLGYAPVSDFSLSRGAFANLRWKQSMTIDLSGGGALFQVPFQAPVDSYLLINLEIPTFHGSFFVFGQVRWVGLSETKRRFYLCGVQFILREDLHRHFSDRALSELPAIILSFDKKMQMELDAFLKAAAGHRIQGGDNDDK
jgi:hypothetical protein